MATGTPLAAGYQAMCAPKEAIRAPKKGLYDRLLVPRLTHGLCGLKIITKQRQRVVPRAEGVVVEIGLGSGLNLAHYDPDKVMRVIGIEPDAAMLDIAGRAVAKAPFEVEILNEGAEKMSLDSHLADTVVVTYTFCSIPELAAAMAEIRRVMKPSGRLVFAEHGRSLRPGAARWQDRLNPYWKRLAGGCNINRDPAEHLRRSGFRIEEVENFSLPMVPHIIGHQYVGSARAA